MNWRERIAVARHIKRVMLPWGEHTNAELETALQAFGIPGEDLSRQGYVIQQFAFGHGPDWGTERRIVQYAPLTMGEALRKALQNSSPPNDEQSM